MKDVAIAGSAVMPNAIYAQPEEDLIMRCVVAAARDAGVQRGEIRAVIAMTPRPYTTQHYQTQHISTRLGLAIDHICELEMAAFGLPNALRMATALIRERDMPAVAIFAASRESTVPTAEFFGSRSMRTADASFVGSFGMVPMVWNALAAREMMAHGEATEQDFAGISVRLRRQAVHNPYAYFREEVSAQEVLESRMVASPLRLLMVCPRTDGAACLIVAREDVARRRPERAIVHLAAGMAHDGDSIVAERAGRSMWQLPSTGRAMADAFARTGLDHGAIDVVEPWIPFAPMEMMVMRGLGFGPDYAKKTIVSPSGGPVARGYPLLATGFYNLHEIIMQLRGEAGERQVVRARVGMTVTETGNYNECVVDLFSRLGNAP
jgi:acetyl-CoA acetyltransferase